MPRPNFKLQAEHLEREVARLQAELHEMTRLATSFVCDEIDYMRANQLGDPEQQHNIKWARRLGIDVFSSLSAR